MKKEIKTNAMRLLDKAKIPYETLYYDLEDEKFSGEAVRIKLNVEADSCLKTLALKNNHDLYVIVIPVNKNIDLKKAAKSLNVKSLEMVKVKDLLNEVGYERGSVTPIGIRKRHEVVFDESINRHEYIEVSGGLKGISLKLNKDDLVKYLDAKILDVCEVEND